MIITDVVAKTEYFDGTPAAGFEIELDEKKLKTDINGVASTKIKGDFYSRTLVSYNYINAKASLPEIGYVYEDMSFRSVNSDVEIKTKAKNDGDSVSLEIQTFNVDFTGLDDIGYDDADKLLRDFDGSLNLDVSIVRTQYRVLTGKKIYDPYTKTFTEEYGYRYEEKTEYSNNITVSGGKPQSFVFPFENYDASGSYKIVIRGKDKSGREFIRENYLYLNYYENDYDLKYVYCTDRSDNSEGYAIGDPVSISLYGSGKSVDDVKLETGTFLFIRASDRLIDYTVTKNNSLDFIFNGKVLPNIEVIGVWFDGRAYKTNNYGYPVKLNRKTRELNAEIETDKENYKPGETAKLRFKLTGPDKKPVKGYINVNIIDEALLSVSESFDDINSKVFEEYYEYSPEYVISHIMVDQERGAGGAGNGDGARSDFRDTALFKTVETDNNGAAEIDVKLPDNITSWRIFWQAFKTDDIMAGSGKTNVISTLPFFIDIRLYDTYLVGDKPQIGIRCAGREIKKNGNIQYTVEIPSLGFKKTESASVSEPWHSIELPELTEGSHTVTVSAEYNGLTDKITTDFKVLDSIATSIKTKEFNLTNDTTLDIPSNGAVRLVFADTQKIQVIRELRNILSTGAIRVEQLIAKKIAEDVLAATGEKMYIGETDYTQKIAEYQKSDGSVSPFTYGDDPESALETTVMSCAPGIEGINKSAAAEYLYSVLRSNEEKDALINSLALVGLAALKEPVLQYIANSEKAEAAPGIRLNLALARILIGDGYNAKESVNEIIKTYCETSGNTMYMNIDGSGREETIKNTANLALAATLLDLPEGEKLFQYVLENQGVSDLYLLQQAMALRHKAQSVNRDAAFFDYVSDGKKTRVNLNISYSVMLTAEQLRSMKFENINQDIKAYVIYTAPGFPQGTNPMLSVSHKYTDVDSSKQNLTAGEISYSISESAPDGCYSIAHILPAGLVFSRIIRQNNRYDVWVSEVKGRQVTFTVYKEKNKKSGKISFYARPVMTGSFKYEGTFISNLTKPEFTNQSPGSMITIK